MIELITRKSSRKLSIFEIKKIKGKIKNTIFSDLKKISKLVHEKNAIIIGDGVSYAPHGFPNVKELDVDFYTFSLYKTFGPHITLLYGKEEILKKLPNQNESKSRSWNRNRIGIFIVMCCMPI